jgi:anti-sigma factor RsiW
MRCDEIEKLVPLYVEGDLPARRAERVRRHVEGCAACRSLLDGFRSSQRWLHGARAPEVGGAALEALRRTVWRRIEAEPPRSAAWREIERIWAGMRRWVAQPTMATLALFVVVTGSFALSRVTATSSAGRPGHTRWTTAPASDGAGSAGAPAGRAAGEARPEAPSEPMLAQASADLGGDGAERDPTSDEPGADDSLRIEIQTRDPDVRIIWFSPTEDRAPAVED